jgi:hypothetical protein
MKTDQIHALFAEIMDELAQLKKQGEVKQTAAPVQQAQPVDLSPVLAQIKALEQRLVNLRVSVPEKPFKALQEQNLALYEEIKEIRSHTARQNRILEQNWQQKWLGWAKESKAFLICLGCLVLSMAVILFHLGDYWQYKKDHEAMILLRAFNPEVAEQATFHIETDSLREIFLPRARQILADSAQVQANIKSN